MKVPCHVPRAAKLYLILFVLAVGGLAWRFGGAPATKGSSQQPATDEESPRFEPRPPAPEGITAVPEPMEPEEKGATPAAVGAGGAAPPATSAERIDLPDPGVSASGADAFDDALAGHGRFEEVAPHGRVFIPGAGFRPYRHGRWEPTEYGWTWVSGHEWATGPEHYGRWAQHPEHGWIWIPDTAWGPAWVSWRVGKEHAGWAPLGPDGEVAAGSYAFAPLRELDASAIDEVLLNDGEAEEALAASEVVAERSFIGVVPIMVGPPLALVAPRLRHPPRVVALREARFSRRVVAPSHRRGRSRYRDRERARSHRPPTTATTPARTPAAPARPSFSNLDSPVQRPAGVRPEPIRVQPSSSVGGVGSAGGSPGSLQVPRVGRGPQAPRGENPRPPSSHPPAPPAPARAQPQIPPSPPHPTPRPAPHPAPVRAAPPPVAPPPPSATPAPGSSPKRPVPAPQPVSPPRRR